MATSTTRMSTWRYIQNGQTCGPVETAELKALLDNGTLPPDTPVWKGYLETWVPANSLEELTGTTPPADSAPGTGAPPPGASTAPPPETDATDIAANKVYAVLAYLGPLFLVPLLAAPQSRFARY